MPEITDKKILEQKIEAWKNKLIDLSRRNRLLNFKPTKVTTIEVVDELPSEIYKSMVVENNSFHFISNDENSEDLFNGRENKYISTQDNEFHEYAVEELEEKHTDLNLQTNLTNERLQKNLKRIHFKANQLMEEQGNNILYLTLGIFEWFEVEHSDVKNRSPLIMLPVELKKRSIRSKYKLFPTDEEPFVNPALQYKMNNEFNLNFPELELENDIFDPMEYFSEVDELIKSNPNWKITNDIFLGLFSFTKFVMFKDLEKYNDIFTNNQIVQALAGVNKNTVDGGSEYPTANELDEKCKPLDLFQVLNADSSQQEAMEAVKAGNSIVVQGPPGTGKSQTITNLIAELLANNKKVLFVSEKMAALDVVYGRLQAIGLGDYCLEIHSRKSNKKYVLSQLKDAYESTHPGKPIIDGKIDDLVRCRKILNDSSKALHTPLEPFYKSPYWFIGELNQLSDIEILDIDFSKISDVSYEQYESILSTIETLKERVEMIGHPHTHPFWGCEINTINEFEQQQISKRLESTLQKFEHINTTIKSFSNELSVDIIDLSTTISYCLLLTVLSEDHKIPNSLAKVKDVNKYYSKLKPILNSIAIFKSQREEILKSYHEKVFDEDIIEITESLNTKYKLFWRIFKPNYYKIKKSIAQHLLGRDGKLPHSLLISNLNDIFKNLETKKQIDDTESDLTSPLSSLWASTKSNTEVIRTALDWLQKYSQSRVSELDDNNLIKYILESSSIPEDLLQTKSSLEDSIQIFVRSLEAIENNLKVNNRILFKDGISNTDLKNIGELLNKWKDNTHLIVDWTRYQRAYGECNKVGLGEYLEYIYLNDSGLEEILKIFKKSFLFNKFQMILNSTPILNEFESLTQDQIVLKFQELDTFQLELAKNRVLTNLYNRKPDSTWEGTKSSQLGYLQRQFRLKRGHHSIRKVFTHVPNIVQQLCPCLMMSPLSLSQYIDPEIINFDFVIFDEASQMSPVDSLGAIIRGEHLVCVGDTKQLPPTTFFDRASQIEISDDDSEDFTTPDLESILDECLTIGMKEFYLKWHYRSRHESLIHFSNISFYKNNLNTFPSPARDNKQNGVSLIKIDNGVYDRGGSQKNILEAKMVAKSVFSHYRINPEKSLGVGTFSQAQQTAILDELEMLRKNDLSLEHIFSDNGEGSFFVKNLETIQGDERDIIFISVGYGRDVNGKITMNFGPLNKTGGERRLNVLVTRAREKVEVYTSITGDDFDLSKTQALGVHSLKKYLDFARSKGDTSFLSRDEDYSGEFDESNIFERSVYNQLIEKGIKAIPQVGYAGYKIDFGILNPDDPSKFILALECDGASYHSSSTARDRDRLRQQVLENLGWRFHRIWSTDWFLNPSREMSKLLKVIEDCKLIPLDLSNNSVNTKLEVEEVEEVEEQSNNNNFGIKIVPYEIFPVSNNGPPDYFYSQSYGVKQSLVLNIADIESPIHIKELCLRVIQHYQMNKVGSKILTIVESIVKWLSNNGDIIYKNDFIYKSDDPYLKIRTREKSCPVSNIEFVSTSEIHNAIILVICKEISTPRIDLVPKVARIFGYQHTGKKIQNRINKQIEFLFQSKKIRETTLGLELIK
jgi:very-short-patch-repair endonuclease